MSKIGAATVVSDPITNLFPLYQWLYSVKDIADEIFILIGDNKPDPRTIYTSVIIESFDKECAGESLSIIEKFVDENPEMENKINFMVVPWSKRLGKWERASMKNQSIKLLESDWILFTDVDELIDDSNLKLLRAFVEGDNCSKYDALRIRAINYYRDLKHVVKDDAGWFKNKLLFFRNNIGLHFGTLGDDIDTLVCFEGTDIDSEKIVDATGIFSFHHVGHARPIDDYKIKKNNIENDYHPSYTSHSWSNIENWEWDMSITQIVPVDWYYPKYVINYEQWIEGKTL